MGLLIGLSAVGLVLWIICLFWNLIHGRAIPRLAAAMDFPLPEHPLVSILIPARNEADILSQSLPRFLAQDYDNYEVILVDDASTDGTSAVARQFAESFPG